VFQKRSAIIGTFLIFFGFVPWFLSAFFFSTVSFDGISIVEWTSQFLIWAFIGVLLLLGSAIRFSITSTGRCPHCKSWYVIGRGRKKLRVVEVDREHQTLIAAGPEKVGYQNVAWRTPADLVTYQITYQCVKCGKDFQKLRTSKHLTGPRYPVPP